MRKSTCLLPKVYFLAAFGLSAFTLALLVGPVRSTVAQETGEVVPASYQSGSFFNQKLGTALRFNYHTRGYGTQDGVVSLGGMKVFNMDDATVFVDGQGTLSDDFGGGFNLGVGYRQLTTTGMSFDPQRILGIGFWTDGQSTSADNFFSQLGFSLESLGESFDLRLNGHFPLEQTQTSDPILTSVGTPLFVGNNIFGSTESFITDTAHSVVDGEVAKRILDLDAWAFVGGYQLGGGGVDSTGYRAGVRGYAVPDLALSLQVTDDDIYATNVMFGITWFIGRTNKCNGPCGTIMDRFREPVLRNDFIAITSRRGTRAAGDALTEATSNETIRLVHIDSNAGTGGDGTIENPFDEISDIDALANPGNSQEGDILYVHSDANATDVDFTGAAGRAQLQDNQLLFGEGTDQDGNTIVHIVDTNEFGTINLPETSTGSQAFSRVTIDGDGGTVLTLADNNTVNNLTINNASIGVLAAADDPGVDTLATPTLQNLQINDAGIGVALRDVSGAVLVENTVEINRAIATALEVTRGTVGMDLAATINDSLGRSLVIQDRTGGTINYTGTIDDDANVASNSSNGVLFNNNSATTINLTNALDIHVAGGQTAFTITNHASSTVNASGAVDLTAIADGNGLLINTNDVDSSVTFADLNATALAGDAVNIDGGGTIDLGSVDATRMIANRGDGNAVVIDGEAAADNNATITIGSTIENRLAGGGAVLGRSVLVQNRTANDVIFNGTVNDEGEGLLVNANSGGQTIFSGAVTTDTGNNTGVTVTNANTDAITNFGGGLDITTTGGTGFLADGAGTLLITNVLGENNVTTGTGTGVDIQNTSIDTGNVTFNSVNTGIVATNAINLENLDGAGQVIIGDSTAAAGSGGTVSSQQAAIRILNADDVVINNMIVDNAATSGDGVDIDNTFGEMASFSGLDVTTNDGTAFSANGAGTLATTGTNDLTTNTGKVLEVIGQDIDGGGAVFSSVNSTGTVAGTAVELRDITSGGQLTVGSGTTAGDGGTITTSGAAAAILVDNARSVAMSNVTIENGATTGGGIEVINNTAGSRTFSGMAVRTRDQVAVDVNANSGGSTTFNSLTADTTTGGEDAISVHDNTGGTVTLNTATIDSAAGNGMTIADNGNANVLLNSSTVNTAAGTGLFVTGTGTVTTGGTSNITSATGIGVDILNAENANINGVTVDAAAANAFRVRHTNATNSDVTLNNITVTDATDAGVNILSDGTAEFDLTIGGATINVTGAGNEGIVYDLGASHIGRSDFTLTGSTITAANDSALLATLNSGSGDVRFLFQNNTNLAGNVGAGEGAVQIDVGSGVLLNATIGNTVTSDPGDPEAVPDSIGDNNLFTNTGAGTAFQLTEANAVATINLDLRDNTAAGASGFSLSQSLGTFNLVDGADTIADLNNVGLVTDAGVITPIAPAAVAQPTAP